MKNEIKKFSDVGNRARRFETISFEQLVGKEIVIYSVEEYTGRYGLAYLVTFSFPNNLEKFYRTIAGGVVVMAQLEDIVEYLPVSAKVVRETSIRGRTFYALE